jgi:hypothetical protein
MRSSARALLALAGTLLIAGCDGSPGAPTVQQPPPATTTTTTTTLPAASQGCRQPASRGSCRFEDSTFRPDIDRAIARVQREQPGLFDFSQGHGDLSFFVRDVPRYHEEVVKALRAVGLCAVFDGEEVAVKNSNDFSDQYDIITSGDFVRWGDGAYASTCRPAGF